MLIETARRAEADVKRLVAVTNRGGLDCAELREALSVSKAIGAALSAFQTNAASIIARSERHGDGGTGVLAEAAGLSRRDARGQVKAAEAIAEAPSIRDAVEQGRVSQANARRLAEAVEKTSADAVDGDAGLLAKAESLGPEQFAKEARRWTADRQDDGGEREYGRLRAKRSLHVWNNDDGMVQLHGVFDPVTGKRIKNRLRDAARRMYNADKKAAAAHGNRTHASPAGERRTFDQCMADAFAISTDPGTDSALGTTSAKYKGTGGDRPRGAGMVGTGAGRDMRACVGVVTSGAGTAVASGGRDMGMDTDLGVDGITARHGDSPTDVGLGADQLAGAGSGRAPKIADGAGTVGGAGRDAGVGRSFADISVSVHVDKATGAVIAELPDGARLPEPLLEELVCNARLTGFVFGSPGTPIWQTRSTRTATERQRRWLLNRWGGCFHCSADPTMCQIHHIVPVSRGGETKIDNMVPVCWECHQKIHHHRWQIRKRPDGRHSLHPPNSTHYGPAHAPEQPILFKTTGGDDHENPDDAGSSVRSSEADPMEANHQHLDDAGSSIRSSGSSDIASASVAHPRAGPATARAALRPRS